MNYEYSKIVALFDLDGVILDTESQYTTLWESIGIDFLGRTGFGNLIKGQTLVNIFETYFIIPFILLQYSLHFHVLLQFQSNLQLLTKPLQYCHLGEYQSNAHLS